VFRRAGRHFGYDARAAPKDFGFAICCRLREMKPFNIKNPSRLLPINAVAEPPRARFSRFHWGTPFCHRHTR
jgi:hypothetical protein